MADTFEHLNVRSIVIIYQILLFVKGFWRKKIREPLKTHFREKELLAPIAVSSLLTLRGLPGNGEVSSLRDRGADRQTSKLSEPFLALDTIISFSPFKAVFGGTYKKQKKSINDSRYPDICSYICRRS